MVYKLYISRRLPENQLSDSDMERIYGGFQKIYEKYGVNVIGAWENVDDSLEYYLITNYRDDAHYENATTNMRKDPEYASLSKELQDSRESIRVINLKKLPSSIN